MARLSLALVPIFLCGFAVVSGRWYDPCRVLGPDSPRCIELEIKLGKRPPQVIDWPSQPLPCLWKNRHLPECRRAMRGRSLGSFFEDYIEPWINPRPIVPYRGGVISPRKLDNYDWYWSSRPRPVYVAY